MRRKVPQSHAERLRTRTLVVAYGIASPKRLRRFWGHFRRAGGPSVAVDLQPYVGRQAAHRADGGRCGTFGVWRPASRYAPGNAMQRITPLRLNWNSH
jgi:hypothetical protein